VRRGLPVVVRSWHTRRLTNEECRREGRRPPGEAQVVAERDSGQVLSAAPFFCHVLSSFRRICPNSALSVVMSDEVWLSHGPNC
jgi:hypothetical protein